MHPARSRGSTRSPRFRVRTGGSRGSSSGSGKSLFTGLDGQLTSLEIVLAGVEAVLASAKITLTGLEIAITRSELATEAVPLQAHTAQLTERVHVVGRGLVDALTALE